MAGGQNDNAPLSLADRCRAVEFLVLDVDGVLTDGGIVYGAAGTGAAEVVEWKQPDLGHAGKGLVLPRDEALGRLTREAQRAEEPKSLTALDASRKPHASS